eukprot:10010401-Heterocapsa_arctica.AAC.1
MDLSSRHGGTATGEGRMPPPPVAGARASPGLAQGGHRRRRPLDRRQHRRQRSALRRHRAAREVHPGDGGH